MMNAPLELPPTTSPIRAFIAAPISEAVRGALADIQQRLKRTGATVGWVAPQNIHLTILFLGAVFETQAAALATGLDSIAAGFQPDMLAVNGLGYFGSARAPRVIWAGLTGNLEGLMTLQAKVVAAAHQTGIITDNKPFKAHLTIGRVRSGRNTGALLSLLETCRDTVFGTFPLEGLLLMKSILGAQGPLYIKLHESRFAARPVTGSQGAN